MEGTEPYTEVPCSTLGEYVERLGKRAYQSAGENRQGHNHGDHAVPAAILGLLDVLMMMPTRKKAQDEHGKNRHTGQELISSRGRGRPWILFKRRAWHHTPFDG